MDFRILMAQAAWAQMWAYVDLQPGEMAVFGYVSPTEDTAGNSILYVDEIFLVPQEADKTGVDFLSEGLPFAIEKAMADDRLEDLRFCAHSHYTFSANWSTVDESMIKKIGSTGTPWFASAIFNKDGDTTARVDLFKHELPGLGQLTVKNVPFSEEIDQDLYAESSTLLRAFVAEPPPKPKTPVASSKGQGRLLTTKDFDDLKDKDGGDGTGIPTTFLDYSRLEEILGWAEEFSWTIIEDDDGFHHFLDGETGVHLLTVMPEKEKAKS